MTHATPALTVQTNTIIERAARTGIKLKRHQAEALIAACQGYRNINALIAASHNGTYDIDQLEADHRIVGPQHTMITYIDGTGNPIAIAESTNPTLATDQQGRPVILLSPTNDIPTYTMIPDAAPNNHPPAVHHSNRHTTLEPWDKDSAPMAPNLPIHIVQRASDIALFLPAPGQDDESWSVTIENDQGTPTVRIYNDHVCDEPCAIISTPKSYRTDKQLRIHLDRGAQQYDSHTPAWIAS